MNQGCRGHKDSLDNQINHYQKLIGENSDRELTGVYYDFGISGYKDDRPGFQKILSDSRSGLFQQIITKSITRFARNTYTMLMVTREFRSIGVGVYFELQRINTLSHEGELLLTLYAAFAQAESDANRISTQMAIRRKWQRGQSNSQLQRIFGYQVEYYTELIKNTPEYVMAGIFTDAGMSGTRTSTRTEFQELIRSCESGQVDLVVTKSISRFARNTADCLFYARRLKELGHE